MSSEHGLASGIVLVISAPSGAGKLTLLRALRELHPGLRTTVSATTRAPRPGEEEGIDYYFMDRAAFEARREAGAFAEWAEVHGQYYGTLRSELERCTAGGEDVILEVDVQGMRNLKTCGIDARTVFVMPPSLGELERRLRSRGANDEADIALRLRNARGEIRARGEFDYIVINDEVARAAGDLCAILRAERCRARRMLPLTQEG